MPLKWPERKKQQTEHYRKRKAFVDRYKQMKGCMICGYSDPRALDLDHRIPADKLFTVSCGLKRSMLNLKTEIRKCDVLCANCHRIKTEENNERQKRCMIK